MADFERIQSTRWINVRRSERVVLRLPIVVYGAAQDEGLQEKSHTLVVNAHGALIALHMCVTVRQSLMLRNEATGQKQGCIVIHVVKGQKEGFEVGVKFAEPAPHFWNVEFPPADWKERATAE